jgi:hypothetical protein
MARQSGQARLGQQFFESGFLLARPGPARPDDMPRYNSLRVGFESDSSSLGLSYNKGGTTIVTYDDSIATGAQEESPAVADVAVS